MESLGIGVLERGIIDRFRCTMIVHRHAPERPMEVVVAESETDPTDLLPGFELP
jgi:hypothetical protein